MTKEEIKYRNGYPTKTSMNALLDEFWKDHRRPRIAQYYGKSRSAYLTWEEHKNCNDRIEEFVSFLQSKGIGIISYRLANSPTTGHINIKHKSE